jgi:simple sugar transport system ATP-binding protein
VLKKGKVVGTVLASETSERQLAEMMVGREILYEFTKEAECGLEPILRLRGLECLSDRGVPALRDLDLDLCGSEILGVAGVEGNGQTELVEAVMGLRELKSGAVTINGEEITDTPPRTRIRMGVSHIPEDRHKRAIVSDFSVLENLVLGSQRDRFTRNGVSIDFSEATRFTKEVIKDYQIATPGPGTLIRHLSGGNQQRVVVAREFSREPKIVIAAQPTRGLDVGATEYVRRKLVEMREQGAGVLLISADLDEIWALSDRVAVIYEGRIVAVKEVEETDQQEIGLLMAGGGNG